MGEEPRDVRDEAAARLGRERFRYLPGENGRVARPDFPGHQLLAGESAREILARIERGDPLAIGRRTRERLVDRALLVSYERLLPRAFAHVAFAARDYAGEIELDPWLARQIDAAIESAIDEDREDERAGRAPDPRDERYAFAAEAWGVSAAVARRACIAFNALPAVVRKAFHAIAVEGKSVNRYASEGHGSVAEVEARVKRALIAIGTARDPGGDDPPDAPGGEGGEP